MYIRFNALNKSLEYLPNPPPLIPIAARQWFIHFPTSDLRVCTYNIMGSCGTDNALLLLLLPIEDWKSPVVIILWRPISLLWLGREAPIYIYIWYYILIHNILVFYRRVYTLHSLNDIIMHINIFKLML